MQIARVSVGAGLLLGSKEIESNTDYAEDVHISCNDLSSVFNFRYLSFVIRPLVVTSCLEAGYLFKQSVFYSRKYIILTARFLCKFNCIEYYKKVAEYSILKR